jgi:hypothetical protein
MVKFRTGAVEVPLLPTVALVPGLPVVVVPMVMDVVAAMQFVPLGEMHLKLPSAVSTNNL